MSAHRREDPSPPLGAGFQSRLHREDLELLADLVAERLVERLGAPTAAASSPRLVTASEMAEMFSVSRPWVYENRDRLGAVRLGTGERGRLRFRPGEGGQGAGHHLWR